METLWRWPRRLIVAILLTCLHSTAYAQTPPCAIAGDTGNSYENCAGNDCERMVCNGSAYVPLEIWSKTLGTKNVDLGNDTSTCNTGRTGRLRWTGTALEICNGTAWTSATASSGDVTPTYAATQTCNSANAGKLSYNVNTDTACYCSGLEWKKYSGSGSLCSGYSDAYCWGSNSNGQAPTNTVGPFTAIDAYYSDTCVLKPNGDARCWGEAGSATTTGPFLAIATGYLFKCAIKSNKDARCWGSNTDGQAPATVTGPFIAIDAADASTCALKQTGDIKCWGNNSWGQAPSNIVGPFTSLTTFGVSGCALKTNGDAQCWGENSLGQAPPIVTGPFKALAGGNQFACGLKTNGDVQCWGPNTDGRAPSNVPGPFIAISAGFSHVCAIKSNGNVQCWGDNGSGQAPSAVTGSFTAISSGLSHTCTLKN